MKLIKVQIDKDILLINPNHIVCINMETKEVNLSNMHFDTCLIPDNFQNFMNQINEWENS